MKKFLAEFREFASKGDVIDLAVGVIIGGAIKDIVTSLVNDVFTPILGFFLGHIDIKSLAFTIKSSLLFGKPITISYGDFLQSIINFLITAFCIFIMIKAISNLRNFAVSKVSKETTEEQAAAPKTEDLLIEIRDLLKEQAAQKTPSKPEISSDFIDDLEQKH